MGKSSENSGGWGEITSGVVYHNYQFNSNLIVI